MPPRLPSAAALLSALLAVFVALMMSGPVAAHAQTAAATPKRVAPPGYTLRFSPGKVAPAGTRTREMARCPRGTVPLSGGAFVQDEDLLVNLSDSFASGSAWVVDISNASTTDNSFQVIVTCARKPPHYKVVRAHPATLAPQSSESFFSTCPSGSKAIGGGASVASIDNSPVDLGANLADTLPDGRQWQVQENNAGTTNVSVTAVAVCASLPSYRVVVGPALTVSAQSQAMVKATCPAPTVVVGGGAFSDVLSLSVDLAWSTMDEGFDWFAGINNVSDGSAAFRAVVVCAT